MSQLMTIQLKFQRLNGDFMKNRIFSLSLREIKKQFFRFLALLIMSFLGVFVYVGIKATAPDMIKSVDKLYDTYNVYDLKLISNIGFSDNTLFQIKELGFDAYGIKDEDLLFKANSKDYVINVSALKKDINTYTLCEGRIPTLNNEIAVERNLLATCGLSIGDTIELNNKNVKIVGVITNPIYINCDTLKNDRGLTNVGSGTINFYGMCTDDFFNFDYYDYTKIYIKNTKAKVYETNSKDYLNLINNDIELLNKNLEDIEATRKSELMDYFQNKLEELNILLQQVPEEVKAIITANIVNIEEKINSLTCNININDRLSYTTYKQLIDDAKSIENLSKVFPIVFYAVALLVSLVSMRRMVTEDRQLIGNLKSMGFSNLHIMQKYIVFSLFATIIGALIGAFLGNLIIPLMIWNIYKILFSLPKFYITFDISNFLIGCLVSTVCIVGATILTAFITLKEKPASLLRPKSIPSGKKILLERIKPLWSRLSFSAKVTLRNIFRYKKRGLVTIIGICGCTALMLCGFGIKNAISDIPSKQYEDIYSYDAIAYLSEGNSLDVFERDEIVRYQAFYQENIEVLDYNAYLFVIDDYEKSKDFITIRDVKNKNIIELKDDSLVITDKLADLLNKGIDDYISLSLKTGQSKEFKITGICENYINHYIYVSSTFYEELGYEYTPNITVFSVKEDVDFDLLKENLMTSGSLLNISYIKSLTSQAKDMLGSLDNVVIILIVLSMMLSFVVLYNLSNINISERRREIASLKVLGFYDKEVDLYIAGENIILTIIGISLGLIFGYFLSNIVVGTVEIEYVRFIKHIKPISYIYSALLSALFMVIVNFIAHFLLKRINMIDSLKSVE